MSFALTFTTSFEWKYSGRINRLRGYCYSIRNSVNSILKSCEWIPFPIGTFMFYSLVYTQYWTAQVQSNQLRSRILGYLIIRHELLMSLERPLENLIKYNEVAFFWTLICFIDSYRIELSLLVEYYFIRDNRQNTRVIVPQKLRKKCLI